jgi:hypothetical protein
VAADLRRTLDVDVTTVEGHYGPRLSGLYFDTRERKLS